DYYCMVWHNKAGLF
nr:immunoglobulin light chain junction region [Macaca mulatta]MOW37993.1 immunoglobulin light chain junction region [Macaca mulatta]MOW38088.1 immunoglobulin light chain junction region [Macaca mulatta]MOW38591.1 immunoglobulin light chain junction region [Macaca mulatta]MOW38722.1 immunoglobulin light chain junction region [Macaca mulatta]